MNDERIHAYLIGLLQEATSFFDWTDQSSQPQAFLGALRDTYNQPEGTIAKIARISRAYSLGCKPNGQSTGDVSFSSGDDGRHLAMRSVFERIRLDRNSQSDATNYRYGLPLSFMDFGDGVFPKDEDDLATLTARHRNMKDGFAEELGRIQTQTYAGFADNLLYLLEKYASRIPAVGDRLPEISLYDHARTTAAFTLALYDFMQSQNRSDVSGLASQEPFLLLGGDVSGIQKFIYHIIARGAAKNLKGRSFYLQLMVDNVVSYLLGQFNLLAANVVYSSGGSFYLLLANTPANRSKLEQANDAINARLYEEHGTALYLALDTVSFGEKEIISQQADADIGHLWQQLAERLGRKKSQRFKQLIKGRYASLFEPIAVSSKEKRDAITGDELVDPVLLEEGKEDRVNRSTKMQIGLGSGLKSAAYWVQATSPVDYLKQSNIMEINPLGLGVYNYFLSEKKMEGVKQKLEAEGDRIRIARFNQHGGGTPEILTHRWAVAWYGGNDFPQNQFGEPKTFSELSGVEFDRPNYQEDSQQAVNGPDLIRLGVLRMDVDNLGAIFKRGLPARLRTFSAYSTLSRSLDYFFKGYLNAIQQQDAYKEHTQIIYSGGDDLFIVGKWDLMPAMAAAIRESFSKWTCHNPDLTLSGGLAIVGAKSPILQAADMAASFEHDAKLHQYGSKDKNAFALMSYLSAKDGYQAEDIRYALGWDAEYPAVWEAKEEIASLLERGVLPTGFPSEVFALLQQAAFYYAEAKGKYLLGNNRVIWLVAYNFTRAQEKGKDELNDFLNKWVKNLATNEIKNDRGKNILTGSKYHALQLFALAARWATLEGRSKLKS